MSLPYRWHASGTQSTYREPLLVGSLIAIEHAVYRVMELRQRPDNEDRPNIVVVRPAAITSDDPRARDHDRHFSYGARMSFDVYRDEHYPICAKCHEPLPCREQMVERVAEASIKKMGRYELAGVCPDCSEVVTARQKARTFSENIEVMFGPPVTFHLRGRCWYGVVEYEKRWVAADPENRKATYSCPGHVTTHSNLTYDCTQLNECPGPQAAHPSYSTCECPDCHARGLFGCSLTPQHKRNEAP